MARIWGARGCAVGQGGERVVADEERRREDDPPPGRLDSYLLSRACRSRAKSRRTLAGLTVRRASTRTEVRRCGKWWGFGGCGRRGVRGRRGTGANFWVSGRAQSISRLRIAPRAPRTRSARARARGACVGGKPRQAAVRAESRRPLARARRATNSKGGRRERGGEKTKTRTRRRDLPRRRRRGPCGSWRGPSLLELLREGFLRTCFESVWRVPSVGETRHFKSHLARRLPPTGKRPPPSKGRGPNPERILAPNLA
jgi:hypothetical protein